MRGTGGKLQWEVVSVVSVASVASAASAVSVASVASVVSVAVYVPKRSFAEMKDESYQETIGTSGFPPHPAPLSSALRLQLVEGYLLLSKLKKLLSSYCKCLDYFHWVLMLGDVGAGCSMSVGHGLV